MPIKFICPKCKRAMTVSDDLAGKKGRCSSCKEPVIVPAPTPSSAPAAPQGTDAPRSAPAPVDIEAEVMAVLADNPPPTAEEARTVDFACPQCDEPVHLPAELAGKKTSCPACRRIIKVPELVKIAPKDSRNLDPHLPSGARRPEVPAPEGAWASTSTSAASRKALEEAGVIREERKPIPLGQKVKWGTLAATGVAALVLGTMLVGKWVASSREQQALQVPRLDYASSDAAFKKIGREGQALLHAGASEYYLRANGGAETGQKTNKKKEEFDKALSLLDASPAGEQDLEREGVLHGLAVAGVDLGGDKAEVEKGSRLKWDDAQKVVVKGLTTMRVPEARLEAFRAASLHFIARGQPDRVRNVASLVYTASPVAADLAEALAVGGLELLRAGNKQGADRLADEALKVYALPAEEGEPPPLRSAVLALAVALGKKPPTPGEARGDEENAIIGEAEGLALQGRWDEARAAARRKPDIEVRLLALMGLAAAARGSKDAGTADLEEAVRLAETELHGRRGTSWLLLRLTRLGTEAGLGDDRLKGVVATIPDRAVRGQAELVLFRARLAASKQVVEDKAVENVDAETLSHQLAREDLARHNIPYDSGWAKVVQGWPEPQRAFGSLGRPWPDTLARNA